MSNVTRESRKAERRLRRMRGEGGPLGLVAWVFAIAFFVPIAYMLLQSLHQEVDAAKETPAVLAPITFEQYARVFDADIYPALINSLMAAGLSTVLVVALGLPAAYATAIKPVGNAAGILQWVLSTKFLPLIAALLPVYLVFQNLGLLDNVWALIIFYSAMNLPVAIWMMHSFLADLPKDIMAAAEIDGASLPTILRKIVLPLTMPGISATALICFIFSWNEFLFALNMTSIRAKTASVYLVSFITSEGLFLAQLSAAAIVVSLPVVIAGWIAQDKLVQGLSLGAVK